MKKIYLVDVSSMFFRAFYAIPPLNNSKGLPTNALYGFTSMCIRLLREKRPEYMVFCFDRPEPSFRAEVYEDYKANRTEMPDDLEPQIPYISKISETLGIPCIDKKTFEADDIIGTIAKKAEAAGIDVVIVSGDKDFAQLISPRVCMYDSMKEVTYDVPGVVEKWGVEPTQIIDYLALIGDSSDNIPGVRGIGPKGAQKLLAEFKTLDGIYQNIDKIKGATQKKLIEGKDSAYLAKQLVTIVTDVKLDRKLEDFKLREVDKDDLKNLFEDLEFTGLLKKLYADNNTSAAVEKSKPKKAKEKSPAKKKGIAKVQVQPIQLNFVKQVLTLAEAERVIRPESMLWISQNERGMCFANEKESFTIDGNLEEVGQLLQSKNLYWSGYNLKKSWHQLGLGLQKKPVWDGMLATYVLTAKNTENLPDMYTAFTEKPFPELTSPEDELGLMMELKANTDPLLEERNGKAVYEELELPLVPVLFEMEKRGILVDAKVLADQSVELLRDITALEKQIFDESGETFNLGSPKQLAQVLFEKLKIPPLKKTKTGYSTDSDVLAKCAVDFPVCGLIMQHRELCKLKSTYVDPLPTLIDAADGRLHTSFHQALTSTGRLSSSNPNLQNLPIRTERGRKVREAIVAPHGYQLISADYSQIELRVLAEITKDPALTSAFQSGKDIHAATAAEIFDVKLDAVTSDQRRMAKAVNFGIAYGQGVFGLAETLGISREESKQIIESYFKKFKNVRTYMSEVVEKAKEDGYVETLFGRRRYLPELESRNHAIRKFGERAAINAPMQGTASDLVKLAMIKVADNVGLPMLLQVHDELVFECPTKDVPEYCEELTRIMESVAQFSVPLKVNVASGPNWDAAH